MSKNADSALKLGQARGAIILTISQANIPVSDYSPTSIKSAVTGTGRADKQQMQFMIKRLLNLDTTPEEDAADALAAAFCHAQHLNINALETDS